MGWRSDAFYKWWIDNEMSTSQVKARAEPNEPTLETLKAELDQVKVKTENLEADVQTVKKDVETVKEKTKDIA